MKLSFGCVFSGAVALLLTWFVWTWGICRFYVPPNHMAVITAKTGKQLDPGQILADDGQKGIRKKVLGEGRHFLNPIRFEHEILPVVTIEPGKVGVVTAKVGEDLSGGEFLADRKQKGIWRNVLGPGKYRINPYGYKIDVIDAISIPIGYAGVITSLSGAQAPSGEFASKGEKGVRKDILQPGLYYINPKEFKVDVLEIGVNQVSLIGKVGSAVITKGQLVSQNVAMEELQNKVLEKQKEKRMDYLSRAVQSLKRSSGPDSNLAAQKDQAPGAPPRQQAYIQGDSMSTLGLAQFVEFPSRDGFQIRLDMTVEFELLPDLIAWIYRTYGDLPAVVDKVIMPQITSISRNKGSEYRAKDFIVGEGREKFQEDLTKSLAGKLEEKRIIVHNALIRHVDVPEQILEPIQQASIAIEQDLTNKERQNTARKLAELNTELSLIEQKKEEVGQETEKIKAEIKADQEKQVAEIEADAVRKSAEIARDTASVQAKIVRKLGEADAKAVEMVEGEKAKGLQLKSRAFGDVQAFTMWRLAKNLPDDIAIRIIHAGDGTLWTDLEKADAGMLGGSLMIKEKQK